jgi:hypothetical protein
MSRGRTLAGSWLLNHELEKRHFTFKQSCCVFIDREYNRLRLCNLMSTGAAAIIRKSILPFKIPEHQKTFLFGELCFVWAFSLNQLGEITLVKVYCCRAFERG